MFASFFGEIVGVGWRRFGAAAETASTSLPPSIAEPPPDSVLYLVCFHLPITLTKDWRGSWQAKWNESLIAKTEDR